MPHVEIKCYPGRTEAQKQALADKVAEDVAEILGSSLSSVSVSIQDVPQENWKTEVWEPSILPEYDRLYKKPGYHCE